MNENVKFFAEKGYLFNPEFLEKLPELNKELFLQFLEEKKVLIINEDLFKHFIQKEVISNSINNFSEKLNSELNKPVKILQSYNEKSSKREVKDFVSYFVYRYNKLKEILQSRLELANVISINRAKNKINEKVALIGIVKNKHTTKNENLLIEIEDLTGSITLLINKNRFDLFSVAKDIILDEVIGITGSANKDLIFTDNLFFPEVPLTKEFKKSPKEEYAVFISDLHIGNKTFLEEDFKKFLEWIVDEKENTKKIKYLFIIGDLIEGVGIYPGQENDLSIKDYYKQYERFVELLDKIPEEINIILCPGNHDALRLDEPQPAIGKNLLGDFLNKENVYSVSNPALVNIGTDDGFPGFDVLIYHGGSFTYYADVVESIRLSGGLTNSNKIMEFLLKKRHLAPTHTSTSYLPGNKDPLVINKVPDFFVSGHIHRCSVGDYNSITLLNCSCWVPQSDYMEKRGLVPEPSRAILVNLKTRNVKVLQFDQKDESK